MSVGLNEVLTLRLPLFPCQRERGTGSDRRQDNKPQLARTGSLIAAMRHIVPADYVRLGIQLHLHCMHKTCQKPSNMRECSTCLLSDIVELLCTVHSDSLSHGQRSKTTKALNNDLSVEASVSSSCLPASVDSRRLCRGQSAGSARVPVIVHMLQ